MEAHKHPIHKMERMERLIITEPNPRANVASFICSWIKEFIG